MSTGLSRGADLRLERHLLFFSAVFVGLCVAYIPYTPGGIALDISAVAIPLAVSLGLVGFTLRAYPKGYETGQVEQIVEHSWIGFLVSAAIGGLWLAFHVSTGAPVGGSFDEILAVLAVGVGAGVVVGNHRYQSESDEHSRAARSHRDSDEQPSDRERVLEEAYWTGRQTDEAIFEAVVETLAEAEGVHPTDVKPIYDYINPEVFTELRRRRTDSQWQLTFFTERYEVRVSSQGTVTVYDTPSE